MALRLACAAFTSADGKEPARLWSRVGSRLARPEARSEVRRRRRARAAAVGGQGGGGFSQLWLEETERKAAALP